MIGNNCTRGTIDGSICDSGDGFMDILAQNHFLCEQLQEPNEEDCDTFLTGSAKKKRIGAIEEGLIEEILEEIREDGEHDGVLKEIDRNVDYHVASLGMLSGVSLTK